MNASQIQQPTSLQSIDILELIKLIPHRYPFLMIDKIINIRDDESCVGIKNVTINEHFFQGHFPDNPVMPGVLQIEGMAQTAAALVLNKKRMKGELWKKPMIYLMTIEKARFRKPVLPGDTVLYHVTKLKYRLDVWKFRAEAIVEDTLVAEAQMSAMLSWQE
jgi:3-hydroxyacyl-[acyl-carrier-protein] dehydratase